MANRAVFIDRDGTMAEDVNYCCCPEDLKLFLSTAKAIKLLNQNGLKVIVVTNQSGIARGYFTEEMLAKIHDKMESELAKEGAHVDAIYYCPHHPDDGCNCRKPKPGLIFQAASAHHIELKHSFVIGDLQMDIDLSKAVGCRSILIGTSSSMDDEIAKPDLVLPDLLKAAQAIVKSDQFLSSKAKFSSQ